MLSIYRVEFKENLATFALEIGWPPRLRWIEAISFRRAGASRVVRRDNRLRVGQRLVCRWRLGTAALGPIPLCGRDGSVGSDDPGSPLAPPPMTQEALRKTVRICLSPLDRCQVRAMPCLADPGVAIPVNRTNAVTPTAIAPMTAKMVCQIADGIAMCAIP